MSTSSVHKNPEVERPTNAESRLSKAQIYSDICEFEETLGKLVASVDKFNPDLKIAESLIEVDKRLSKTLESLPRYDEIDLRAKELDQKHLETDERMVRILETLTECSTDLNALPMLEQVEFERQTMLKQREKVFTNVLLDYAMKLAKFTHVPPTFDKGAVGPNNFVWPAEDAMRRGMLAIASLQASEDAKKPETGAAQTAEETTKQPQSSPQLKVEEPMQRRDSFEFNGTGTKSPESEKADDDIDLDLDLFNSDEL